MFALIISNKSLCSMGGGYISGKGAPFYDPMISVFRNILTVSQIGQVAIQGVMGRGGHFERKN